MNNRVRIVIVGDSGVGKTCLTHLIAHNESLIRPGWTVGCNIQVKIHEFREGTTRQSPYFVELFDIGGSLSHKNTRNVFYTGVHGIILVHDLTNAKSQEQLIEWLFEILNKEGKDTFKCRSNTSSPHVSSSTPTTFHTSSSDGQLRIDLEEFVGATQIPILVMGTKLDLIDEKRQPKTFVKKAGGIADKIGAEEIWLNCRDTRSLAAGTTDAVKLSRFIDRVIEKRELINAPSKAQILTSVGHSGDRRRPQASMESSPTSSDFVLYAPKQNVDSNTPLLEINDLK